MTTVKRLKFTNTQGCNRFLYEKGVSGFIYLQIITLLRPSNHCSFFTFYRPTEIRFRKMFAIVFQMAGRVATVHYCASTSWTSGRTELKCGQSNFQKMKNSILCSQFKFDFLSSALNCRKDFTRIR